MPPIQDVTLGTTSLHLTFTAYGDWIANIFDGNDIQASGIDWTAHGAVTKAHARYLYLHQDSAPIDPLIALFRDSNR